MKKKIVSMALALVMCLSLSASAFAAETNVLNRITLNSLSMESTNADQVITRAHDVEYRRDLVASETDYKKRIGYAGGQPTNGTVFLTSGDAGFYWSDSGGTATTISASVSFGVFRISVSPGSTGSSGQYISAPTNTRCKLLIYKDITVNKYANYERLIGTTNWNFKGYTYYTYASSVYLEVVRV